MRTTLTIADDVAAMLRQEAARSGKMFRDVLNETLRAGLSARREAVRELPTSAPIRVWDGRKLLVENLDNIEEVLDDIEGPWRR